MNVDIYRVHSCAQTLRVHFHVLVEQDMSCSQIRLLVQVKNEQLQSRANLFLRVKKERTLETRWSI